MLDLGLRGLGFRLYHPNFSRIHGSPRKLSDFGRFRSPYELLRHAARALANLPMCRLSDIKWVAVNSRCISTRAS